MTQFLILIECLDRTNNKTTAAAKMRATVGKNFTGRIIATTREAIKAMQHFKRGLVIMSSHLKVLCKKEGKFFEENNILSVSGIALSKNCSLSNNVSACGIYKALQGVKRLARADNIVDY